MKTKSVRSRRFNSKLAAYSATASAALLAAPAAQAAIQNITGLSVDVNFTPHGTSHFVAGPFSDSLNGYHGTPSVYTSGGGHYPLRSGRATFYHGNIATAGSGIVANVSNGAAFAGLHFAPRSLTSTELLLANKSLIPITHSGMVVSTFPRGSSGQFLSRSGYVAFKTGSYYGWLKVKVGLDSLGVPNEVSLVDNSNGIFGAYDNINDVIADGFAVGTVAVPEPSTMAIAGLGLLAFGAAGVRELRRRRQKTAN